MVGTRVYVGNLPRGSNERDLERFFRGYGRIREVLIKNGYGFVEFNSSRDAEDACYELNGKRLYGERVTVERARGTPRGRDQFIGGRGRYQRPHPPERHGPPTRTDFRLIVENLSSVVSWQDLKDYMRQAGEVTYTDIYKNKNKGIVEYASYSDLKNALDKLDNTEILGRKIRLIEYRKKSSRRSHSRSRSRSRSPLSNRSRSKSPRNHSKSPRNHSRSKSPNVKNDRNDRSRSRSKSRDRSRSRTPSHNDSPRNNDSRSQSPDK